MPKTTKAPVVHVLEQTETHDVPTTITIRGVSAHLSVPDVGQGDNVYLALDPRDGGRLWLGLYLFGDEAAEGWTTVEHLTALHAALGAVIRRARARKIIPS